MRKTEMLHSIEQHDERICVYLKGELPPGSEQNSMIGAVVNDLDAILETSSATELVVDCSELVYSYGDAIVSIWLTALKRNMRVRIRAKGITRERLSNLVKISIPVPISE